MKVIKFLFAVLVLAGLAGIGYQNMQLAEQIKDLDKKVGSATSLVKQTKKSVAGISSQIKDIPAPTTVTQTQPTFLTCTGNTSPDPMAAPNSSARVEITCHQ